MKLRRLLICGFTLVWHLGVRAQAVDWQWAKSGGGSSWDQSNGISTDANGNVLIAGAFRSPTVAFDNITLTNASVYGTNRDIFVVKYDPTGQVLWANRAGGAADESANGVCADPSGNVYVTGFFSYSQVVFGSNLLTSAGADDLFIVKYNPSGYVSWARRAGGSLGDGGTDISVDASGNVFVIGSFNSISFTLGNTLLTNSDVNGYSEDIFIAKYDPNGTILWAKKIGGSMNDVGKSIKADAAGNVIVAGNFSSQSITLDAMTLTNAGYYDGFIAKYDGLGHLLWANGVGAPGYDNICDIDCDLNGHVVITGNTNSQMLAFGNDTVRNVNQNILFVAKYDASGNAMWGKRAVATEDNLSNGIAADAIGNIFITGYFTGSWIYFGNTIALPSGNNFPGYSDIFIAKYDGSGQVLWAQAGGGNLPDAGTGVACDANGNAVMTGYFASPSCTIGNLTLSNATPLATDNDYDVFVTKLSGGPVGIKKQKLSNPLGVFPNPFCTQISLQAETPLNNASVHLDNAMGQTVKQLNNIILEAGQLLVIPRDDLPAGLYFLKLIQNGEVTGTEKVVIEDSN